MKKYFIIVNEEKLGPFDITELQSMNIDKNILVWHTGLVDWKKANDIEELEELLKNVPPPIPNTSTIIEVKILEKSKNKKVDSSVLIAKELKSFFLSAIIALVVAILSFIVVAGIHVQRVVFAKNIISTYEYISKIEKTKRDSLNNKIMILFSSLPELKEEQRFYNYLFKVPNSTWNDDYLATVEYGYYAFHHEYISIFDGTCFLPKIFSRGIGLLVRNGVNTKDLAIYSPLLQETTYESVWIYDGGYDSYQGVKCKATWSLRYNVEKEEYSKATKKWGLYSFLGTLFILALGRYIIKLIKWIINTNSK